MTWRLLLLWPPLRRTMSFFSVRHCADSTVVARKCSTSEMVWFSRSIMNWRKCLFLLWRICASHYLSCVPLCMSANVFGRLFGLFFRGKWSTDLCIDRQVSPSSVCSHATTGFHHTPPFVYFTYQPSVASCSCRPTSWLNPLWSDFFSIISLQYIHTPSRKYLVLNIVYKY